MVDEYGGELIGWRIGFIIGRILPTDHCGIVFDRTTVDGPAEIRLNGGMASKEKGSISEKHPVEKQSICVVCGALMCCIMQPILLSLRCDNQVLTDIFVRATLKGPMWDMISIVAEQMVWPSSGVLAIRQCFWRPPIAFCGQSRIGL